MSQQFTYRTSYSKCRFCKCTGHNISDCMDEKINEKDQHILEVTAITGLFPFVKDSFIECQLSKESTQILMALTYLFEIKPEERKTLKQKNQIIKFLTNAYLVLSEEKTQPAQELIEINRRKIYKQYLFEAEKSEKVPKCELMDTFASFVYQNIPDQIHYFKVRSWITRKVEQFHKDQINYVNFLESQIRRFDICSCYQFPEVSRLDNVPRLDNANFECPICQDETIPEKKSVTMSCGHKYCTPCMSQYFESINKKFQTKIPECGMCREKIKDLLFKDHSEARIFQDKYVVKERKLMNMIGQEILENYDEARDLYSSQSQSQGQSQG